MHDTADDLDLHYCDDLWFRVTVYQKLQRIMGSCIA